MVPNWAMSAIVAGPKPSRYRRTSDRTEAAVSPGRAWLRAPTYEGRAPNAHGPPVVACTNGPYWRSAHQIRGFGIAEALFEPSLHVRVDPGRGRELEQLGDQGVRILDRDALAPEPAIVQASRAQRPLHRLMEGGVIVGGNGMQGDAQQLGLDRSLLGEGGVEVRWIERVETIPQGDVRGRRLLGLEGDQAMDRVDDVEWLTPQQELPREGRPVELSS